MRNEHCRTWKLARKLKNVGNETQILYDLAYGKKHSKTWNMRNHTEGPGVWQEKGKSWKMRKTYCRNWNMTRNTKTWKMRNAHCRTWSMAGKMKIMENEKNIL